MALDSYKIKFFAWCKEEGHDKVWGFVEFKSHETSSSGVGSLYCFWGKRGKTYQFKRHYGQTGYHDLQGLARKKTHPSGDKTPYRVVSADQIEGVCPGFTDELENQLLMAKFSGKVKTDDTENHSFI